MPRKKPSVKSEEELRLSKLLREILEYADQEHQYSYYELEAYMLENHPEWSDAFKDKNTRSAISAYLKSAKRYSKVKTRPMFESALILAETEERALKKNKQ